MLKKIVMSLVVVFGLFICFGSISKAVPIQKFTYEYESADSYQSSFNPRFILKEWIFIFSQLDNNGMIYIGMGNPKLDWSAWSLETDPNLIPIPEGEITSVVHMVFAVVKDQLTNKGIAWLYLYGYQDKDSTIHIFEINDNGDTYVERSK